MNRLSLTLHSSLALLAAAPLLHAQTTSIWNNPAADNQWINTANWTTADVPDSNTEIAQFAASDVTTISLSAPVTVKRVSFAAGAGDYTFSGSPLTVDVAQAGTGSGTGAQILAGAASASFAQLVTFNDAGGGNDSSILATIAAGGTLNFNGGVATSSNRNLAISGDGVLSIRTSAAAGTGQFQQQGNTTMNFFVNPTTTGQIRSFSNTGGGIRMHSNISRPMGLGVTGSTSHIGRIFLAASGITTSGALTTTGATTAGPHTLDTTFGVDIPGTGLATHSGTTAFGALTSTAVDSGTTWVLRLDAAEDDTLVMSGIVSGFPTGYALPVIRKQGPGSVVMSGANTHTVPMEVAAGKLTLTPAQTSSVPMTVQDGATLAVNLSTAGTTLNFASLTTSAGGGALTPSVLELNAGGTGNPTAPVINAGLFTVTGPTTLKINGALTPAPGTPFPVISYSTLGGLGAAGLSLSLPFRAVGSLVDDPVNSRLLVEVTAAGSVVWRGGLNGNWDIDSVGDGSAGTANWFAVSGPNTYVQDAPAGTDSVLFDDTATGTTTVNLTATLTPSAIRAANSAQNYTWNGTGKISGSTGIVKTGTGALTIANTGTNDNSGANSISDGALVIGDGTAGAGSLGGALSVIAPGQLKVNRPDGVSLGALTGDGGLELLSGEATFSGGNFSGPVSGAGNLRSTATLALTGSASAHTGLTTISGGQLQLNRPAAGAVGGNILITGTGQLALQAADQVADNATISHTGSSTDSIPTQTAMEVVKEIFLNSSVAGTTGGQVILRNGFTVTGTATVSRGILGVASSHNATVNAINLTCAPGNDGIVRIAGSGGPSMLDVGAGGITASGGDIQVKFNTNDQNAVVNLGGNFTSTGNVTITNANYAGASLNVINLTGDRIFDIAAGTITTVAPDFGDAGGLLKTGGGALVLNTSCNAAHTGATTISGGTLTVNGTIPSSAVTVASGGTLNGDGTITASATVQSGGTLSAGSAGVGALNFGADLTLAAGSVFAADISAAFTNDRLVIAGSLTANGTIKPVLSGYAPVLGDAFRFMEALAIAGTPAFDFSAAPLNPGLAWDTSEFLTLGSIKVVAGGSAYDTWAADKGLTAANSAKTADPDADGIVNALEFYLDGNPLLADTPGPAATLSGNQLRLTFKRRDDAEDLAVILESSSTLAAESWTQLQSGTGGVIINMAENDDAPDTIEVLLPATLGERHYVRLRLTLP